MITVKYTAFNVQGQPVPMQFDAPVSSWKDLERAFIEEAVKTGDVPRGRYVVSTVGGVYKPFDKLTPDDLKQTEFVVQVLAPRSTYLDFYPTFPGNLTTFWELLFLVLWMLGWGISAAVNMTLVAHLPVMTTVSWMLLSSANAAVTRYYLPVQAPNFVSWIAFKFGASKIVTPQNVDRVAP